MTTTNHNLTEIFVSVSAVGIAKITENGEESDKPTVSRAKPAEAAQQVVGEAGWVSLETELGWFSIKEGEGGFNSPREK